MNNDACATLGNVNASDTNVSVICLQQADIKKHSVIDFTKTEFTEEERLAIRKEVEVIKQKYPTYIPIIVHTHGKDKIGLTKRKFLVGGEITVGQFLCILRKKISKMKPNEAIFLLINNTVPVQTATLSTVYHQHVDINTNMLRITICKENTFG